MIFGASVLWVLVALLWHPEGDDEIPQQRTFPWERWFVKKNPTL